MAASTKRVLGLACSPRKGGNTDLMLDAALEGATREGASIEKIFVPGLDIHPCRACNACYKDGHCVQKDDMQLLYPKLLSYEAIALAAPIFSMGLAAQAKIMIDRMQCCWAKKFVLKENTVEEGMRGGRRGLWLGAAGMDRTDHIDAAWMTLTYFFAMLEIGGRERVTYAGVDKKGDILKVEGAIENCRDAGKRLVEAEAESEGEKWQSSLS
jgi:multimeric flavodoxin WrbA